MVILFSQVCSFYYMQLHIKMVLTVVYDGNTDSSEVWIFDSQHLHEEPVCKLGLPSVIPHSFHGTWKTGE